MRWVYSLGTSLFLIHALPRPGIAQPAESSAGSGVPTEPESTTLNSEADTPPYNVPPPPPDLPDYPPESPLRTKTWNDSGGPVPRIGDMGSFQQRRGVFVRGGAGPSFVSVKPMMDDPGASLNGSDGVSCDFNVSVGGAVTEGFALALDLTLDMLASSEDVVLRSDDKTRPIMVVGALSSTWFPMKSLGLNVGASLGLATILAPETFSKSDSNDSPEFRSTSGWGSLQLGYDWLVTGHTSIGVLGHLGTTLIESDASASSLGVRVIVTSF